MYAHPPLPGQVIQVSSKPTTDIATSGGQSSSCGSYRKLQKALKEVEQGMPVRTAAEIYGVPKSTLYNRAIVKVAFEAHSRPDPFLSREEEELVSFLVQVGKIGYARTKKQDLSLV